MFLEVASIVAKGSIVGTNTRELAAVRNTKLQHKMISCHDWTPTHAHYHKQCMSAAWWVLLGDADIHL